MDFLICDLSREESHLVLTRLLRVVGEDAMRTQVELVRHARQKVTAAEVERQLKQLQQLQQLQASCSPLMGTPFAVGERGADEATPRGAGKTPSKARLRGIKNRVRDAFKRQLDGGRPVHNIRLDALEEDLQRVRDDGLRGQLSLALGAMEAITEELVDRASQVRFPLVLARLLLFSPGLAPRLCNADDVLGRPSHELRRCPGAAWHYLAGSLPWRGLQRDC